MTGCAEFLSKYMSAEAVQARLESRKAMLSELVEWGKSVGLKISWSESAVGENPNVFVERGDGAVFPVRGLANVSLEYAKQAIDAQSNVFDKKWYGKRKKRGPSPGDVKRVLLDETGGRVEKVLCDVAFCGCFVSVSASGFLDGLEFCFEGPMTEGRLDAMRLFFLRDLRGGA